MLFGTATIARAAHIPLRALLATLGLGSGRVCASSRCRRSCSPTATRKRSLREIRSRPTSRTAERETGLPGSQLDGCVVHASFRKPDTPASLIDTARLAHPDQSDAVQWITAGPEASFEIAVVHGHVAQSQPCLSSLRLTNVFDCQGESRSFCLNLGAS